MLNELNDPIICESYFTLFLLSSPHYGAQLNIG
jgi:hypothetical protein